MKQAQLNKILKLHKAFLQGDKNGKKADLSETDFSVANLYGANLSGADLSESDLSGANFSVANLYGTNLSGAFLSGANFFRAELSGADLSESDLSGANLSGADLSGADLSGANLSGAILSGAILSGAILSGSIGVAPTSILLASWGKVSNKLCKKLMAYDAQNHPKPELFNVWKEIGVCPYADCKVSRSCNFSESIILWSPSLLRGRKYSAYELMLELFKEKEIKF